MSLFNKFTTIQEDFNDLETGCLGYVCYTTFQQDTNGEVVITRKVKSVFENNPLVVVSNTRIQQNDLYETLKNYFFNQDNSRRNTCQEYPADPLYISFVIEEDNAEVFDEETFTPEDLFNILN